MVSSELKKIAVGCQGGGMHAAFEVGVLDELLKDLDEKIFELVGLSGTSAGALCALMAWYGLASKKARAGSPKEAMDGLNDFWENFVANTGAETVLNVLTYRSLWAEEQEVPGLGAYAGFPGLNPYGLIYNMVAASLPHLGVRKRYIDLNYLLNQACPDFKDIDWDKVQTRLLIGASEVVNGFETVFDSNVNKAPQSENKGMQRGDKVSYWRQRLPLTLSGVAASGTLPTLRKAEQIKGQGHYWDGLYSHNPPVREFFSQVTKEEKPDELWIVRINPQQWPETPTIHKDIQDRENELMGNLSLNKELDFIQEVNDWADQYEGFGKGHKHVTVRTIKMKETTADNLQYSSKFNRSRAFMEQLRDEGRKVARNWLNDWRANKVGEYPQDAAYP
jgi:NTE family protein